MEEIEDYSEIPESFSKFLVENGVDVDSVKAAEKNRFIR